MSGNSLIYVVPVVRLELTRARGPGDFESPASTNSTTPALFFGTRDEAVFTGGNYPTILLSCQAQSLPTRLKTTRF